MRRIGSMTAIIILSFSNSLAGEFINGENLEIARESANPLIVRITIKTKP